MVTAVAKAAAAGLSHENVVSVEHNPSAGQRVEVRGDQVGVFPSHVAEAKVVRHRDDQVGPLLRRRLLELPRPRPRRHASAEAKKEGHTSNIKGTHTSLFNRNLDNNIPSLSRSPSRSR